jgi:signal transduction histidine kinase/CheY-like chemotaxis protein/F0F1-type ATP synthase assembly protein I
MDDTANRSQFNSALILIGLGTFLSAFSQPAIFTLLNVSGPLYLGVYLGSAVLFRILITTLMGPNLRTLSPALFLCIIAASALLEFFVSKWSPLLLALAGAAATASYMSYQVILDHLLAKRRDSIEERLSNTLSLSKVVNSALLVGFLLGGICSHFAGPSNVFVIEFLFVSLIFLVLLARKNSAFRAQKGRVSEPQVATMPTHEFNLTTLISIFLKSLGESGFRVITPSIAIGILKFSDLEYGALLSATLIPGILVSTFGKTFFLKIAKQSSFALLASGFFTGITFLLAYSAASKNQFSAFLIVACFFQTILGSLWRTTIVSLTTDVLTIETSVFRFSHEKWFTLSGSLFALIFSYLYGFFLEVELREFCGYLSAFGFFGSSFFVIKLNSVNNKVLKSGVKPNRTTGIPILVKLRSSMAKTVFVSALLILPALTIAETVRTFSYFVKSASSQTEQVVFITKSYLKAGDSFEAEKALGLFDFSSSFVSADLSDNSGLTLYSRNQVLQCNSNLDSPIFLTFSRYSKLLKTANSQDLMLCSLRKYPFALLKFRRAIQGVGPGGSDAFLQTHFTLNAVINEIILSLLIILIPTSIAIFMIFKIALNFMAKVTFPLGELTSKLESIKDPSTISQLLGSQNVLEIKEIKVLIDAHLSLFDRFSMQTTALLRQKAQAEKNEAIARTTAALAHDVRKPFSMFKMIISTVGAEHDLEFARQYLKESLSEVNQAMTAVDGLISDVLEIGGDSKPQVEPTNPETLIEATLNEIFRVYPESHVAISYAWKHTKKVDVDPLKIARVLSNIVGNSIQAIAMKGTIWFKTREFRELENSFVEFTVGNSDSFIPEDSLAQLFDAFFTSGKKGGTGLGLAIAQKIVLAHGGTIWCRSEKNASYPNGVVEFIFTLPASEQPSDGERGQLPKCSSEVVASFDRLRKGFIKSHIEIDGSDEELENALLNEQKLFHQSITILLVDDENIYKKSLAALISQSDSIKKIVDLHFASDAKEAVEKFQQLKPHLLIQDVDLGKGSENGYEVIQKVRKIDANSLICVHSNRSLPVDYKTALESGADSVLPKPMSRPHFLKLALQAIVAQNLVIQENRVTSSSVTATNKSPEGEKKSTHLLPEFAVLDDSKTILASWKMRSKTSAILHTFNSPALFWKKVAEDHTFLDRIQIVVTAYHFAPGVLETGISFAYELRKQFTKPILLSSDAELEKNEFGNAVTQVIEKRAFNWEELQRMLIS